MLHGESAAIKDTLPSSKTVLLTSVVSSAGAGIVCDFIFFPIDTLKTRLQSQHGFIKSGGCKRLYQGVIPVLLGSAPTASFFFVTYEGIKHVFQPHLPHQYHTVIHMGAASFGEVAACLIRVPVEVIKQRKQALLQDRERLKLKTLYRGYGSTVLRDLPFAIVQMPLWEYFKHYWKTRVNRECTPFEGALCGALSASLSTAMTTPLDVAKTRIMLSDTAANKAEVKISVMLKEVYRENGIEGLFAGFMPRIFACSMGGFVFFGVYEQLRALCKTKFSEET